jgi:diguanylate cyclase (GGDEF)-like protein/PAS domain S-box-containing protein
VAKKSPREIQDDAHAGLRDTHGETKAGAISLSALREQAAGLRRAQLMANLSHVITKPDGSFETWSETLPKLLGLTPDQVVTSTRRWLDVVHPADRSRFRATALEARTKRIGAEIQYRLWRTDGAWVHVRQVMEPIPGNADSQGRIRWFNTLQDVTVQVRAQERINRLNRVYAVLSGINGAIVRIRDREALFREACRIAIEGGGFTMAWIALLDRDASLLDPVASAGNVGDFFESAPVSILDTKPGGESLAGRAVREKRPIVCNDLANDPQRLMREQLTQRGIHSLAILPLTVDNIALGVLALYAAESGFFDEEEMRLLVELAGDVSFAMDHIGKAQRLDYLSYYDALTALPNRALFHERLKQQLEDAARKGERIGLMVVDVERFKSVNDTLGRQAGDALLAEVAKRLKNQGYEGAWAARLGADHFAIVTPAVASGEDLARRAERRLRDCFGTPMNVAGTELRTSARIGVALSPGDGADTDTLLRNAEAALKQAKLTGERYVFYRQEMTARIAENLALENKLRRALEHEEFVLHYQPKVDLKTGTIVGLEALIRWKSPELGLVPPIKFIPLLEETGLILEVGAWALRRASLDHKAWFQAGLKPPRVAVNVSAIQLRQRDFVSTVEQAVMEGLAPVAIDLEITESLVMQDIQASIAKLGEARGLGLGVAIDDFGTGYSSLAYLARLPVETLKIDRTFVKSMCEDVTTRTLVETIVSLAHALRLKVVAEGVETEEQAALLRELHCDQMQGYLFSRPLPAEELVALLRSKHPPDGH